MAFLLLLAFLVRGSDSVLLLRHFRQLALEPVVKDFYLVLQRQYLLIFDFHLHVQGHHFIFNMIALGFKRVNNMVTGIFNLFLETGDFLF